ncbi:hypothetical protein KP509_27G038800 [Ceratopteris richardii]|uniref:Hydrophobic seed protein domain-containing protein n=1 Tax=Ceratopteris richardii TaxID=49495 RepID=A0A8T2RHE7_CERRI|nr:hypothetical protein KP509_27G038800 [Ceratopteris richardii]
MWYVRGGSGTPGSGAGGGTTTCPLNIIKLNVCSTTTAVLVDVEVCLCLAIDAKVLGISNIDIPKLDIVARIMTACGQTLPPNFTCPP